MVEAPAFTHSLPWLIGLSGSPATSVTTPFSRRTIVPQPPWQLRHTALSSLTAAGAFTPLLDDREGLDLHHEVRMRELAHLDRGAGRQRRPQVLLPHLDVAEKLLDVGHVGTGAHQIVERRPRALQRQLEVLSHLPDLRPHVALADEVPLLVARQQARHEHHRPAR